jgi:hypothetical protein
MPPGGTHFLYTASIVVILLVLPKTWASNHPDNALARATLTIFG